MALNLAKGYCDLNIPVVEKGKHLNCARRALDLGYETLALSVSVHQEDLLSKGKHEKAKKAKQEKGILDFPQAPELDLNASDYAELHSKGRKPIILKRLCITFKSNDFLPFVTNSVNIKGYDLISVCPESTVALQALLKSGAFRPDIITFDPERVKDVMWSRKLYLECVERGISFELPYAPCIRDATARKRIIAQSHNYHAVGKSKAIIVSSQADSPIEMRGPHDVANLGFLFGLNEQQGKDAVAANCWHTVKSAAGRKVGPYRALIQKVDHLQGCDKWKVPEHENSSSDEDETMEVTE